jgi:hypothetical protein
MKNEKEKADVWVKRIEQNKIESKMFIRVQRIILCVTSRRKIADVISDEEGRFSYNPWLQTWRRKARHNWALVV